MGAFRLRVGMRYHNAALSAAKKETMVGIYGSSGNPKRRLWVVSGVTLSLLLGLFFDPDSAPARPEYLEAGYREYTEKRNRCAQCEDLESYRRCIGHLSRGYTSLGWARKVADCLALGSLEAAIDCVESKGVPYADNCDACHPGTEFEYDVLFPDHTVIGCESCHASTRPTSHAEDFTDGHGSVALDRAEGCRTCHDRDYCLACHEGGIPAFHQVEDYDHGSDAERNSTLCGGCHEEEVYCKDCHGDEVSFPVVGNLHPSDNHDAPNCSVCHHNPGYMSWGLGDSTLNIGEEQTRTGVLPHDPWSRAENQAKWILMWWLFALTLVVFAVGVLRHAFVWMQGKESEDRGSFNGGAVLRSLWWDALLQRATHSRDKIRWWAYSGIHFGFYGMLIGFVVVVVTRHIWKIPVFEDSAAFAWAQTHGVTPWAGLLLDGFLDLSGLFCLAGILLAYGRRWVWKSTILSPRAEDLVSVTMLLAVVVTGFLVEATKLAPLPPQPAQWAAFVSTAMARVMGGYETSWTVVHYYLWLIHLVVTFVFLSYFPYGKMFHAMTSPLSVALEAGRPEGKGSSRGES